MTAKIITEDVNHSGHQVSYSTGKKIINNLNQAQ